MEELQQVIGRLDADCSVGKDGKQHEWRISDSPVLTGEPSNWGDESRWGVWIHL